MCSACGILRGGVEWVDGVTGDDEAPHKRWAERSRRVALINMLLEGSGVRLTEHGRQLILRGPTGATRLVSELAHVWRSADELGRRIVDPLDQTSSLFSSGKAK
jgi:hypothetical protein